MHRLSPLFWAGGTIPLASMNGGILSSGTLLDAFAPGAEIWGISMNRQGGGSLFFNTNHFYSMICHARTVQRILKRARQLKLICNDLEAIWKMRNIRF
ncbi:hypothetical protein ACFSHT_39955 [Paraburkholderia silviterrae]|uniref:Uncharacterized protein n=1 Tax=Paraburkholderia silviterrae TaxID=2528715 RepID=A0A4V2ZY90_9BURK|nr:hypothetical protein [Paraburkholderia silviterrae]TDG19400.1 hypothetical protein EYW47_30920 [Paraburkholderia silviterrae]